MGKVIQFLSSSM